MKLSNQLRKGALLLSLALAAALPANAFAASQTGSITETIDNAATISVTVPTTLAYAVETGTTWKATLGITGYTTNSPSGSNLKAVFSALTSPTASTLPVTSRTLMFTSSCSSSWQVGNPLPAAAGTGSGFTLYSDSTAASNISCSYAARVLNVGIGTYSGSIAWTATTTP